MTKLAEAVPVALGVVGALATDVTAQRLGQRRHVTILSLGLALVAAVYPVCRTGWRDRAAVAREVAGVFGYSAIAAISMARADADGHRIIGVAWMTHAVFDAVHDRGPTSRLPTWYPSLCASYDVALGALVARG